MTPVSAVLIVESIMIAAGQPSSARVSTVGTVLTVLALYCRPCQHTFVRMVSGAILRVNGRAWIFLEDDIRPLPELRCPLCGSRGLYVGEPL